MTRQDAIPSFVRKHHAVLFFGAWILLNLLQAVRMELLDDEAYYWVYSRYPSWGYFDHPPLVAFLIRAGTFFFRNEWGVRLFFLACSTATLFSMRALIPRRNDLLFYALVGGMAVLQFGGILAVPDIPLLLFTALFFLAYRRFLGSMNTPNSLLLGAVTAFLCYSKYQGILLPLFTIASNPRLLSRRQTWLAAFTALLLFLPHLYWQFQHGFLSVQYQLFGHKADHYRWRFTLEYMLGQLLLTGPLAGPLLLWTVFTRRPQDALEKALKFSVVGITVFFLFCTLRGKVEANWTLPALVGIIVLSHQVLQEKTRLRKWIYRLTPIALLLILALRTYMIIDTTASPLIPKDEFHGNKRWVEVLRQQSGGLPLVFLDSYQKASKYWFYSGIKAMSLNTPDYRRNNFNLWPLEDSFIGKRVYLVGPGSDKGLEEKINAPGWEQDGGKMMGAYFSFSKLQLFPHGPSSCEILSPIAYLSLFRQTPYDTIPVQWAVFKKDRLFGYYPAGLRLGEIRETPCTLHSTLPSLPKGEYTLRYAIPSCLPGQPSLNSEGVSLDVK